MKGDRGERKVVNIIEDDLGFYAQRTGASGGATSRNRPDVIGMRSATWTKRPASEAYFMEIKSRDDGLVRFKRPEVEDLLEAAERSGATALFVTKPDLRKHDHIYCFTVDELKENEKSFSVVEDMLPGRSLGDIFTG